MEKLVKLPFIFHVVQVVFLLSLMLAGSHCNVQERLNITDLDCFNDYHTKMFCSWKVPDPNIFCSHDFQLEYKKHYSSTFSQCVPENIAVADTILFTECICYIKADFFVAADKYYVQIKSHGISIENTTILAALKVKPKAPVNVTIEHNGETATVHWDSCYTSDDYLFENLNYGVQITSKQEPKKMESITLNYMESRYTIRKRLFRRGHDYAVKIRSKPSTEYFYDGVWSEWSPAVEWHNDYDLSAYVILKNMISVIGPVIFTCIVLCCVCLSLCKKKLWNDIPDPSRSQLVMTMLHTSKVPTLKSGMNSNILAFENKRKKQKLICGKWLKKLISRNQDSNNRKPEIYKTAGYLNCIDRPAINVFIPEMTAIERSVNLSPLLVDTDLEHKAKTPKESTEGVQPLECEFIHRMFLEILESDNEQEKLMDLSCSQETENTNDSLFFLDISSEMGQSSSYTSENSLPETQNEDYKNSLSAHTEV